MSTEVFTLPFKLGDGGNMGAQPGARRVLVVDDDMLVLDVVREMLSSVGHEVTATHNPQNALELIWNEHFDVVLTDLGMPVVSGWAVARQVKAKNALTPVVLLTGWGAQYEEADLSKYGVDLVLSKPLALESLTRTVEELVTHFLSGPGEHRKHMRFRGGRGEFVKLVTPALGSPANPAKIIDVSMGGLSFRHSDSANRTDPLLCVDIISQNGLELDLVPCKVVYDIKLQGESGFSPTKSARRCGVQFEELPQSRLSQLESFIRRHAHDDYL
jgi:CheY-like chemotaxis protein